MALTHAEVVRRDGCWQSDGLADLDGAGARGGLQLPALHRGAPCARHFNVRGGREGNKAEAAEGSKAAEEGWRTNCGDKQLVLFGVHQPSLAQNPRGLTKPIPRQGSGGNAPGQGELTFGVVEDCGTPTSQRASGRLPATSHSATAVPASPAAVRTGYVTIARPGSPSIRLIESCGVGESSAAEATAPSSSNSSTMRSVRVSPWSQRNTIRG